MKRTLSFRMVAAGVVVALTSAVAVTTTTQSASANDYQIIYDNLDDALGVLLEGVADSVEDYLATMSFESAAHVLSDAFVAAGGALVAGTAQFGLLGLGLVLFQSSLEANLDPFLVALDDPSLATEIFTADDLSVIFDNLVPALTELVAGDGGFNPGVLAAVGSLLEGNLIAPGAFGPITTGYFVGDLLNTIVETLSELVGGDFNHPLIPPAQLVFVGALLGGGAADGFVGAYIASVQSTLQGVLGAGGQLAIVTAPLASLLSGFSIPALPIPLP